MRRQIAPQRYKSLPRFSICHKGLDMLANANISSFVGQGLAPAEKHIDYFTTVKISSRRSLHIDNFLCLA